MVNPRLPKSSSKLSWNGCLPGKMGAGYFGKAHLIWDNGQDREREIFTALMRHEPIFLYRQGARPLPMVEGYGWWPIGEHPSWRVYQLEMEVEGK